ncbi:MAG: PAQR family membrane homeostasis protein TrhA [Dehalococcoidia bacterium]
MMREGPAIALAAEPPKPLLRGTFHLAAAIAAPFGLAVMLLVARSPRAYVAAAVFGASLIACYSVSAGYHLAPWPRALRGAVKRLDHAMIFALIAGTYTPFCLIVLNNAWGISILCVVWSLAAAGMLLKIAWPWAPRWLSVSLYLAVGWLAVVAAVPIVSALALAPLLLLVAGGALYSAGALIYAARRPDPYPRVFGYHEVFHLLVVAGGLIHFSIIAFYVLPS